MADWIEPIVERVVSQVLDSHAAQLRGEIVRRVTEELAAQASGASGPVVSASTAELARIVGEIQLGTSQREILRALLDGCGHFATRTALFVVKGETATGWQGRGFRNSEALKDFKLDVHAPAVARAIETRDPVNAVDFDTHFLQEFGSPSGGEARLLPLLLKDKVAALIYTDGGDGVGQVDSGAVELLVLSTSAWLEVNSLRKQVQKAPVEAAAAEHGGPATVAASASPVFNDPFAAHTPTHAMAAAASASVPTMSAGVEAEPIVASQPPPEPVPSPDAATAAVPNEDQEMHRKAQRFARLLVDEIKLYNQAKVAEGRKHKDLYERLKETIEKSRNTYQKRYGNTVAASGNYFHHEVVRSLAEDDISIMGANFKH